MTANLDLQIADLQIVRGWIECDVDNDYRMPLLVVDGKEITWQEMGRIPDLRWLAIQPGDSRQERGSMSLFSVTLI